MMGMNDGFFYPRLSGDTKTRVLLLAPDPDSEPIRCFLLVIDLDSDWRLPSTSGARPLSDPPQRVLPCIDGNNDDGESPEPFFVNLTVREDGQLHSFQRYTALSYTWGDQTKQHTIKLNGKPFSVGDNLHVALRRLRGQMQIQGPSEGALPVHSESPGLAAFTANHGRIIWIDAMCINQADLAERESQVKLMSRIYQQADFVHADLGYPLDNSGEELLKLLQTIEDAGKKCEALRRGSFSRVNKVTEFLGVSTLTDAVLSEWNNYKSGQASSSTDTTIPAYTEASLESQGIPPREDPIWDKWRLLMSSVYFERLWIIQEFVFAKTIKLWVGNVGLDPSILRACIVSMARYSTGSAVGLYLASDQAEPSRVAKVPRAFTALSSLIEQRIGGKSSSQRNMIAQLALTRHSKATDMRDKLYGVLALASDGPQFYLLVSYTSPLKMVFLSFAEQFVQSGHGLEMLYQVNSGSSKSIGTPTWVPDWSQDWEESSIHHRSGSKGWYAAAGSKTPRLDLSKTDSRLTIAGVIVDTIKSVTKALPHTDTFVSSFDFYEFILNGRDLSLELPIPDEYNDSSEITLLTLLCRPKHTIAPEESQKMMDSLFGVLGLIVSILSKESSRSDSRRPYAQPLFEQCVPNAIGRSWCLTENGHFGLVPGRARAGDRVAILYGGQVPFIIRQCSPTADSDHELIGHGYVHGLMNGEAFDAPDFNPAEIALV